MRRSRLIPLTKSTGILELSCRARPWAARQLKDQTKRGHGALERGAAAPLLLACPAQGEHVHFVAFGDLGSLGNDRK